MEKIDKRVLGKVDNIKRRIKQFGKERENMGAEDKREIYNKLVDEIIQAARSIEM